MTRPPDDYASRAGTKLNHALESFNVELRGRCCADFGSNAGGFVDCLLRNGAAKVYAVERGFGVLNYRLRADARVIVMERTDARHLRRLPDPIHVVTIDAGWTRQHNILPAARCVSTDDGLILTLVKTHYEADPALLKNGVLPDESIEPVLKTLRGNLPALGLRLIAEVESPIRGQAGNREFFWHLVSEPCTEPPDRKSAG
ncbi:MAG: TlyA family rRNA (cytidine-2'-O)-methyltransferase [Planctomycetota bacterium]|nr:TlyA family rRNA (cytidine-2'-O)-methyltransferase [Planctomycetota bacterium]